MGKNGQALVPLPFLVIDWSCQDPCPCWNPTDAAAATADRTPYAGSSSISSSSSFFLLFRERVLDFAKCCF